VSIYEEYIRSKVLHISLVIILSRKPTRTHSDRINLCNR